MDHGKRGKQSMASKIKEATVASSVCPVDIRELPDGGHAASYTLKNPGDYRVHILVGGSPIGPSPFYLSCGAGAIEPRMCKLLESMPFGGAPQPVRRIACLRTVMWVQTCDVGGNERRKRGNEELWCELRRARCKPVECKCVDTLDGKVEISFASPTVKPGQAAVVSGQWAVHIGLRTELHGGAGGGDRDGDRDDGGMEAELVDLAMGLPDSPGASAAGSRASSPRTPPEGAAALARCSPELGGASGARGDGSLEGRSSPEGRGSPRRAEEEGGGGKMVARASGKGAKEAPERPKGVCIGHLVIEPALHWGANCRRDSATSPPLSGLSPPFGRSPPCWSCHLFPTP